MVITAHGEDGYIARACPSGLPIVVNKFSSKRLACLCMHACRCLSPAGGRSCRLARAMFRIREHYIFAAKRIMAALGTRRARGEVLVG